MPAVMLCYQLYLHEQENLMICAGVEFDRCLATDMDNLRHWLRESVKDLSVRCVEEDRIAQPAGVPIDAEMPALREHARID